MDDATNGSTFPVRAAGRYRLQGKFALRHHSMFRRNPASFASIVAVTLLHGCNGNGFGLMPIPSHLPHQPETIRPLVWSSLFVSEAS